MLVREDYHSFIGSSESMQTIYRTIEKVAISKASILITGETGTGKELCAEAIHKQSLRADKPFIVCNCAAIPEKLMESHLFGHVKGAFTGADRCQEGLVSKANGGTLFLDEIGELPLAMQSTLLRFVQNQTFCKVGSHKLEQVDIRFIWATNRNLRAEIQAKQFREDLFYRINTIEIKLPALRHRGTDILLLANFFLHKFAQEEQKDVQKLSADAEQQLLKHNWLGNVRELKHLIHNLVILNQDQLITADMINMRMDDNKEFELVPAAISETDSTNQISKITINQFGAFKEMEKEIINKAIEYCNGNVTNAAKLLKIGRATIFNKLKQYRNS
jgi:two-component system repressor protein LuxO